MGNKVGMAAGCSSPCRWHCPGEGHPGSGAGSGCTLSPTPPPENHPCCHHGKQKGAWGERPRAQLLVAGCPPVISTDCQALMLLLCKHADGTKPKCPPSAVAEHCTCRSTEFIANFSVSYLGKRNHYVYEMYFLLNSYNKLL